MIDRETASPTRDTTSASMQSPATPKPKTSTQPVRATTFGGRLQPTLPGCTPVSPPSPDPTYTPQTPNLIAPGSALMSCTSDETLFTIVKVHTAKCTECDKRNMDTMRRCPGCTFQVCSPCYTRRVKNGGGLMHGNMSSIANSAITQRTVRRRPLDIINVSGLGSEKKSEAKTVDAKLKEDGASEARSPEAGEKQKEKSVLATPASKTSSKKRALRKRPIVEELTNESSDDSVMPGLMSPTPSKRRRTALKPTTTSAHHAMATPSTFAARIPTPTPTILATPSSNLSSNKRALSSPQSTRCGTSDVDTHDLLYEFAVKGYDQPLLSRREPVRYNPVIRIPNIIKRGCPPRHSKEQSQKTIQDDTSRSIKETSVMHVETLRVCPNAHM